MVASPVERLAPASIRWRRTSSARMEARLLATSAPSRLVTVPARCGSPAPSREKASARPPPL